MATHAHPTIIQIGMGMGMGIGIGMGIGVSGSRFARAVSSRGQLGVVSGADGDRLALRAATAG